MYGSNWWLPLKWSTEICCTALKEGMIKSPPGYNGLLGQIANFRSSLTKVVSDIYDGHLTLLMSGGNIWSHPSSSGLHSGGHHGCV